MHLKDYDDRYLYVAIFQDRLFTSTDVFQILSLERNANSIENYIIPFIPNSHVVHLTVTNVSVTQILMWPFWFSLDV